MAVPIQLPLEWNIYLLSNSDIVNFVWRTHEEEAESIFWLIFACLVSLIQSTVMQITISINVFICFKYYTL